MVKNWSPQKNSRSYTAINLLKMITLGFSTGASTSLLITKAFASFIKMYILLLFLRVLLSWFPTFNWDTQPWISLRLVTDPYLNCFRGILPPLMGQIDDTTNWVLSTPNAFSNSHG